jgi:two-component system, response regulator PdtaR
MKNKIISIMLVEDEALIAQYLKMELELEGFHICACVSTGEDAVKKAETEHPDLILMDINLAGDMDGITAVKRILDRQPEIQIIFMTGFSRIDFIEQLNQLHISHLTILQKPVEVDMIKPLVDEYFGITE